MNILLHILEFFRRIGFIGIFAFIIEWILKGKPSTLFVMILLYLICNIIASIDEVIYVKKLGGSNTFLYAFGTRFAGDFIWPFYPPRNIILTIVTVIVFAVLIYFNLTDIEFVKGLIL